MGMYFYRELAQNEIGLNFLISKLTTRRPSLPPSNRKKIGSFQL